MYGLLTDEQRYNHVMYHLEEHLKDAQSLGYNVFAIAVQGSQNYNLDLYTNDYISDVDTRCIVIPSFEQFCREDTRISFTYVREDDSHVDMKDVASMFQLFKKQNVQFLEVLFSDFYWVNPKYKKQWDDLMTIREEVVTAFPAQLVKTLFGMSMEKYKALKHPYPTIIDKITKYGYDGKQLHHIIRINEFLRNYISGKPFSECLKDFSTSALKCMMDAKLNKFSLSDAEQLAKEYVDDTTALKNSYINNTSEFVNTATYEKLEDIKVSLYKQSFKEELLSGNCS